MRYNKLTKPVLENLYLREGLSSREIAAEIGCSPLTVVNYLRHFNIPIRPLGGRIGVPGDST